MQFFNEQRRDPVLLGVCPFVHKLSSNFKCLGELFANGKFIDQNIEIRYQPAFQMLDAAETLELTVDHNDQAGTQSFALFHTKKTNTVLLVKSRIE